MVKRDKDDRYLGLQCDAPGCETMSPPAADIIAGHGLNQMGWNCTGGRHFCPEHVEQLTGGV